MSFSPLFIGAMVATVIEFPTPTTADTFSPLFIGAMVATLVGGIGRYLQHAFSPLFIGAMVATDLLISSRNGSKRSRNLRLYAMFIILTHRRCPVNFNRSGRHIFSVHQCLGDLRVDIRKSLVCPRTSLGAHGTST